MFELSHYPNLSSHHPGRLAPSRSVQASPALRPSWHVPRRSGGVAGAGSPPRAAWGVVSYDTAMAKPKPNPAPAHKVKLPPKTRHAASPPPRGPGGRFAPDRKRRDEDEAIEQRIIDQVGS